MFLATPGDGWSGPMSDGRPLRSSALLRGARQERLKGRSPNSRVLYCHVTVAVRASWNYHRSVVRCGGQLQEPGRIGQVVGKIDGEHWLVDHVQICGRIIVSRTLEGIQHVIG